MSVRVREITLSTITTIDSSGTFFLALILDFDRCKITPTKNSYWIWGSKMIMVRIKQTDIFYFKRVNRTQHTVKIQMNCKILNRDTLERFHFFLVCFCFLFLFCFALFCFVLFCLSFYFVSFFLSFFLSLLT